MSNAGRMMNKCNTIGKWLAVAGMVILLAACGSKLTNANLTKVKNGMSEADVVNILGKPDKIESAETLGIRGTVYTYQKGNTKVSIIMVNDAVINKSGNFE